MEVPTGEFAALRNRVSELDRVIAANLDVINDSLRVLLDAYDRPRHPAPRLEVIDGQGQGRSERRARPTVIRGEASDP